MQAPAEDIAALIKQAKACYNNEQYAQAIEYARQVLARDASNSDALNILSYASYYQDNDEQAIEYCIHWIASEIQNPAIPLSLLNIIYEKKIRREEQARMREEHARSIEQAKVEERNKVIADLSHSIKNIISTVIDPLENLKQREGIELQIIDNALRGANLVREIVNAMNLSSKGSIEDFYYDAANNTGKDTFDLQTMLIESLKYSVGNMFDGKYFSNFMRKYFPTRDLYMQAKSEWERLSQTNHPNLMLPFWQKYFWGTNFVWGDAAQFVMGNEKGSAIKLLILFQEILLNAVKYSAFVPPAQRFLNLAFASDTQQISVKIENHFNPEVKTKSSGLGHVIIENFAKLINTTPVVRKDGNRYLVEICFKNFWMRADA